MTRSLVTAAVTRSRRQTTFILTPGSGLGDSGHLSICEMADIKAQGGTLLVHQQAHLVICA